MSDKPPFLLSTTDNPYSPFDEWERWLMEDLRLGHDTCGLLARFSDSADVFDDNADVNAIRDVVINNFSGLHEAVVPSDYVHGLRPVQ
jgi:hypothetical protein